MVYFACIYSAVKLLYVNHTVITVIRWNEITIRFQLFLVIYLRREGHILLSVIHLSSLLFQSSHHNQSANPKL